MADRVNNTNRRQLTVQESRASRPGTCATPSAAPSTRRTGTGWRISSARLAWVLNAVMLWTTRYIEAAVAQLRAAGHEIRNEDVARLSPLKHRDLNLLGRYGFTASVPREGLRPLRDPDAIEMDDDDDDGGEDM